MKVQQKQVLFCDGQDVCKAAPYRQGLVVIFILIYPSWLYPVTQGAATIWERLNSYTHTDGFGGNNSMNSFNHYSFGAVGQWLINRCLGIERDEQHPAFSHFILRPEPDPTGIMTYARGHLDTRHGRIESSWQIHGDGSVSYSFTIPPGTSATCLLPGKAPVELKPGEYSFKEEKNY